MNTLIKRKSPYGVASLTLGIISIIFSFFWYISVPTGIVAIITGNKGRDIVGSKINVAGKVTGIVGLSITGVLLVIKILIILTAYASFMWF